MAQENFSSAFMSMLMLHTELLAENDGKAMHGPVSVPPSFSHHSILPSLSSSVLPPSFPRLLYSSWPLHNRTQIEIVLRRKRRAFLSLTRTHTHRVTAGLRIRPASLCHSTLIRSPTARPLVVLLSRSAYTLFVCTSCAYVNGGSSSTVTHLPCYCSQI